MLWIQIFVAAFFFLFGLFILIAGLGSSAAAASVLVALFFFALAGFFLINLLGFRSQYLKLREDGISFRLPPLGTNFVLPWKLRTCELPWNGVRALDLKLRNLGGPQRVYVLRTSTGDVCFFWPQWPNAEALAREIVRHSGAFSSTEDMDRPPAAVPNQPPVSVTRGERFMRGFGTAMLIITGVLGLLCLIAILGAKPENRWEIGKVLIFLAIAAGTAQGMRRYRRIR